MSREKRFLAVVLKMQSFGESDELVAFFTKEQGKVRALAKAVKLSKSKLKPALQSLFLIHLTLAGNAGLLKVIHAQIVKTFLHIRESLPAVSAAFFAVESVYKFSADEHKNEPLFHLLEHFLQFLDEWAKASRQPAARPETEKALLALAVAKFKIEFLSAVGLGVHAPQEFSGPGPALGFSNSRGGFVAKASASGDFVPVSREIFHLFMELDREPFAKLALTPALSHFNPKQVDSLQKILSSFLEYMLERPLKSEKYLLL